ncbi:lipopolysaccharide biosynthesis protein [Jannaschia sp. KMU-145]|uniref:lipopolysaccharide biosynthesis protein n=1 Tax=Jannaschia halovivens TaxID=3388667 RepID=UPI00396B3750
MPLYDPNGTVDASALSSFSGTVLRGSLHTGLSQVVTVGCQVLSVIVLSRLLGAGDFGLVAMVGPVIVLVSIFKELGLMQAIVQKDDLTYGQVNSLFWVNASVSLFFTLLLVLAAPLIADFYREPELVAILQVMAVTILVSGLGAQHFALLNRGMMFGRLAINAGAVAVCTLGTSILWASVAPSPWALVAGMVTGSALGTLMVWLWVPWRPGRPAMAPGTADLLGFGAGITGFKLANFFSRNLDNVLIGRVWGSEALGLYDRAYKLLLFPLNRFAQPLSQIMVPVLSRLQREPDRYAHAFFRVFGLLQLAVMPGVAALTAMADTAVPFLLGAKWAESAPIFAALGIAGLTQSLANPTGWLFISQGRTTEMAWWGLASAIATCTAFAVGVQYGVVALAMAYAAVSALKLLPLWMLICRKGPIRADSIRRRIGPALAAGAAAYGVLWVAQAGFAGPAALRLLAGVLLSYAVFASLFSLTRYGRDIIREAFDLGMKAMRKTRSWASGGTT